MAPFADRVRAGTVLAPLVAELRLADPAVLGLPRGGVPVAAEVARALGIRLDVYLARKIGAPSRPEYGIGAFAEDGEPVYDDAALRALRLTPDDLAATVAAERREVARQPRRRRASTPTSARRRTARSSRCVARSGRPDGRAWAPAVGRLLVSGRTPEPRQG